MNIDDLISLALIKHGLRSAAAAGAMLIGGDQPQQARQALEAYESPRMTPNDAVFLLPGGGAITQRGVPPYVPTQVGSLGFSGDGNHLRPGTVFGSSTNWSACLWAYIAVDRNNYSAPFAFDRAGHATNYQELITNPDGTTMAVYHTGGNFDVGAMAVGTWYFLGMKVGAAGACSAYIGTEGTGALTKVTGTVSTSGTWDQITIGATNFHATEWWNGRICQVRAWNAQLSDAEFYQEKIRATLQRTSDVLGWWELASNATRTQDSFGSNTLTESGYGSWTEDTGPTIG